MTNRLQAAIEKARNPIDPNQIYPETPPPPIRRRGGEADPEQLKALQEQIAGYQAQLKQAIVRTDTGIQIVGCTGNAAGLMVPDDISVENIQLLADVLFDFEERIQLYIGDMLNAVERLGYGDIKKIAEAYGRDKDTLYNWKSICKKVTTSLRNEVLAQFPDKKPLTLTHYQFVAPLPEDQQRYWLNRAMSEGLGAMELKRLIKGEKPAALPAGNATVSLFDKSHMPRPAALKQTYLKARQGDENALSEIRRQIAEYEKWLRDIQESLGLR